MPAKAPCYRYPEAIVETDWLATNLEDPTLRIFDCTTHLIYNPEGSSDPYTVKSGREDYECGHIPGANFLDLQGELSRVHPIVSHYQALTSLQGSCRGTGLAMTFEWFCTARVTRNGQRGSGG